MKLYCLVFVIKPHYQNKNTKQNKQIKRILYRKIKAISQNFDFLSLSLNQGFSSLVYIYVLPLDQHYYTKLQMESHAQYPRELNDIMNGDEKKKLNAKLECTHQTVNHK